MLYFTCITCIARLLHHSLYELYTNKLLYLASHNAVPITRINACAGELYLTTDTGVDWGLEEGGGKRERVVRS